MRKYQTLGFDPLGSPCPANLPQVTETHQENAVFVSTIALGCVVAPNNAGDGGMWYIPAAGQEPIYGAANKDGTGMMAYGKAILLPTYTVTASRERTGLSALWHDYQQWRNHWRPMTPAELAMIDRVNNTLNILSLAGMGLGMVYEGVPMFRGGSSTTPRLGVDYKVGPDGIVNGRGISFNTDKLNPFIQKYGGAFELKSLPDGLTLENTGGTHFEARPVRPMTEPEFLDLNKQINLKPYNDL